MTLQDLQQRIEAAFKPNVCDFKFIDHNHRFQFQVRSPDNEVLHQEPELLVGDFMDQSSLDNLISHVREQITKKP
jgi:hypothetical protein